jgi:hypothetical protein
MTFPTRGPAVYHDALGLQVDNNGLGRLLLGCVEHFQGHELGQRAQLDGETDELAPSVILGHALDNFGENGGVVAHNELGNRGADDRVWLGSDHVHPRGADPADGPVNVEVHDDI